MEDPKNKELTAEDLGMTAEEFSDFMKNSPASNEEGVSLADDNDDIEDEEDQVEELDEDEEIEEEDEEESEGPTFELSEEELKAELADSGLSEEEQKTEYRSQMERRKAKMETQMKDRMAKKAERSLKKRRESLKKAADRFRRKREKVRSQALSPTAIKNYDSEIAIKEVTDLDKPGNPLKITPDVEKMLFPFFISGASIRAIHQQFGRKYDFALQTLYAARDFYKWEQRRVAIIRVARSTNDLEMAERFKDYMAFFDDLLSEAMIRFKNNSDSGQNTNPFNTLKVTNVKDMKELVELIAMLKNGGTKKTEVDVTHSKAPTMSDKKRAALLEILAKEDED